jgi:hypothetical protein
MRKDCHDYVAPQYEVAGAPAKPALTGIAPNVLVGDILSNTAVPDAEYIGIYSHG